MFVQCLGRLYHGLLAQLGRELFAEVKQNHERSFRYV